MCRRLDSGIAGLAWDVLEYEVVVLSYKLLQRSRTGDRWPIRWTT